MHQILVCTRTNCFLCRLHNQLDIPSAMNDGMVACYMRVADETCFSIRSMRKPRKQYVRWGACHDLDGILWPTSRNCARNRIRWPTYAKIDYNDGMSVCYTLTDIRDRVRLTVERETTGHLDL